MRYGYKASAEQFGARRLLDLSLLAERGGLDTVTVSDHFQPWRHTGGQAPNALTWLGAAAVSLDNAFLGTSVLTPTLRYHPSVVAQAFATAAGLSNGPVMLGVGTGEALNEVPATGLEWPSGRERRRRLEESIDLIRRLWTEERVTFEGEYYRTDRATIYERPEQPIPIYIAAAGPLAARLVGRKADGFICTSGKNSDLYTTLLENLQAGADAIGRDISKMPKMIEIKVSYDTDLEKAETACHWWGALALTAEEKHSTDDPLEFERLADAHPEDARRRFIVSTDPDEVVEKVAPYVELGFDELVFHSPGEEQERAIELFTRDVLPRLKDRFGE